MRRKGSFSVFDRGSRWFNSVAASWQRWSRQRSAEKDQWSGTWPVPGPTQAPSRYAAGWRGFPKVPKQGCGCARWKMRRGPPIAASGLRKCRSTAKPAGCSTSWSLFYAPVAWTQISRARVSSPASPAQSPGAFATRHRLEGREGLRASSQPALRLWSAPFAQGPSSFYVLPSGGGGLIVVPLSPLGREGATVAALGGSQKAGSDATSPTAQRRSVPHRRGISCRPQCSSSCNP